MTQYTALSAPAAPTTEHSAEPLPFASLAEMERAETTLNEPETIIGIFSALHTPRVLLGARLRCGR